MKLKNMYVAGTFAVALLFAACSKDEDTAKEEVNTQDETFIVQASQSNRSEIELGNLALTKASDTAVKMYAQMMIAEHTTAQNDLQSVVGYLNTTANISDSLNATQVAMRTLLQGLSGSAFDSVYIGTQVLSHQQTLNAFDAELNSGQNARVKAYANAYRAPVQNHLNTADSIYSANYE